MSPIFFPTASIPFIRANLPYTIEICPATKLAPDAPQPMLHSTVVNATGTQLIELDPTQEPLTIALIHDEYHLRGHLRPQERRLFHARHGGILPLGEIVRGLDHLDARGRLAETAVMM